MTAARPASDSDPSHESRGDSEPHRDTPASHRAVTVTPPARPGGHTASGTARRIVTVSHDSNSVTGTATAGADSLSLRVKLMATVSATASCTVPRAAAAAAGAAASAAVPARGSGPGHEPRATVPLAAQPRPATAAVPGH